jgi:hypothetical protein
MNPRARYFTLLDSASSAYSSLRHDHELKWWLPSNRQRKEAYCIASSKVMYRLLLGDVLTIPRNQAFDSPAFLDIFDSLRGTNTEWFNVSLLSEGEPTLQKFVEEVAERFEDQSFLLSAWPGLDIEQRGQIAKNIRYSGNFRDMLFNCQLSGQQLEVFQRQYEQLNYLFEYLKNNPKYLITSSTDPKIDRSLWNRLSDKKSLIKLGPLSEIITSIPKRININEENINNRGVLYKGIAEFPDHRDALREIIDHHYYNIMADSVSSSRSDLITGLYSDINLKKLFENIDAGDTRYGNTGLESVHIQTMEDIGHQEIATPLKWADIVDFLDDKDCQRNTLLYQLKLSNSRDQDHEKIMNNHLEYIVQTFENKISARFDEKIHTLKFVYQNEKEEFDRGKRYIIKIISGIASLGGLDGFTEVAGEELIRRSQKIESERLQAEAYSNHVKKKIEFAGRLRGWLKQMSKE